MINAAGEARIEDVLTDYIAFYQERVEKGLKVDRANCPYSAQTLHDGKMIRQSMLTNPFEKFERKHFLYYAKNLGMIAMNPALFRRLSAEELERVEKQMREDLENYYRNLG